MQVIRSASRIVSVSQRLRQRAKRIGLVPTMGALHEGHLSLIRAARAQTDVVIVTIFVNPLQFGPHEDFRRYPRHLSRDVRLAREAGAHIVFAPSDRQMYPKGFHTVVEVGDLAQRWEGHSRPGHFRGVATVVSLLFQLTRPTHAFFGQKDYQQARVIQRLVRDLKFPLQVRVLPTVREPDGLAMSSRNALLKPAYRQQAGVLFRALSAAQARLRAGERHAAPLIDEMRHLISEAASARIDYAAIVDADTLRPLWRLRGRVAILLAVWIGHTRLIDNLVVEVS